MTKSLLLLSAALFFLNTEIKGLEVFQDTTRSDSDRIENLLGLLTLEEKINLFSTNLGVPRLGIPDCGHFEGLHGLQIGGPANKYSQPTTIHPQAYGLGETWDLDLIERIGNLTAEEMRWYFSQDSVPHNLVMRAPNADLARDPRWGRTEESFGEDPFLTGEMTVAKVKGMQGYDPRYWKVASLMKHFLANSNEFGRDSTSSNFSERLFHEYYSYPFMKGITEGGSRAFMAAYNRWNGIPMAVHPVYDEVVRPDWDMDGIICTDGGAMGMLFTAHHYVDSLPAAAAEVVKAGLGQFLDNYKEPLTKAIESGLVTETDLDKALKGNLKVALKLGLLDPDITKTPYYVSPDSPAPWEQDYAKALAREATAKSVVLLKNDTVNGNPLLPLKLADIKKIALIGEHVNEVIQDWYGGNPAYSVTILEAFRDTFEPMGIEVVSVPDNRMSEAERIAKDSDIVFIVAGNHPYGTKPDWFFCPVPSDGREAVDRRSLNLPNEDMIKQIYKSNPNTVLVLQSSFPYTINWSDENLPAILHFTHSSQETGNGLVDVITGKVNPSGHLTQTWVKDITDLPDMMDYDITNGRTYMYFEGNPLYPFGYGLSYSDFGYESAVIDKNSVKVDNLDESLCINVTLANNSDIEGDEVIQVYASYPESLDSLRPKKQLRAFKKVKVPAGEKITVPVEVKVKDLTKWDETSHQWVLEKGKVDFHIGRSSADLPLMVSTNIK
ncbi:MAG: glycoside hydrolase family 3 C-terminal domain-containing protein [Muribaculaceae bacterium]|nr:glycoside hydrolase family 3 C-terminal domain-containing protein [Muribaculaceae bacterium]